MSVICGAPPCFKQAHTHTHTNIYFSIKKIDCQLKRNQLKEEEAQRKISMNNVEII